MFKVIILNSLLTLNSWHAKNFFLLMALGKILFVTTVHCFRIIDFKIYNFIVIITITNII